MGIKALNNVTVRWPQNQSVPLGGWYDVLIDGVATNPSPIAAWPDGEGKIGSGLGRAGLGAAGIGDPYGTDLGAGEGLAGLGQAGLGVRHWHELTATEVLDGEHAVEVASFDETGNSIAPPVEKAVDLAGTPRPPGVPRATEYDPEDDTLTLVFALSADDEGV